MEYKRRTRGKKSLVFQPAQAVQGVSDMWVFHRIYIRHLMNYIESSVDVWQMSTFFLTVQAWIIHGNFWVCPKLILNTFAASWKKIDWDYIRGGFSYAAEM